MTLTTSNMTKIKATKINMTQIFAESGEANAATVLKLENEADLGSLVEQTLVTVVAISKGKGFQGVVKRHKFQGGRRSHGQKHSEREPGSIGGGGRAGGRVAKGMRMAGRMGGDRVTVKNLRVAKVDAEDGKVYIVGAVPGRRGASVEIKNQ